MLQDRVLRTRWTFPDTIPRLRQHSAVGSVADLLTTLGEDVNLDLDLGRPARTPTAALFRADPADTRVQVTAELAGAVSADLDGPDHALARVILISCGFREAGKVMQLIRIDGEEEHYAAQAVTALREAGFTVTADPQLDPEQNFDEADQQWVDCPMPWLTRQEVLQVSAQAQEIFEDIRSGRLVLHAHAVDIPVAVGTYTPGDTVILHGSDHLCQVIERHTDPLQGMASFLQQCADTAVPGPPPTPAEHRVTSDRTTQAAEHIARSPRPAPRSRRRTPPARPLTRTAPTAPALFGDLFDPRRPVHRPH